MTKRSTTRRTELAHRRSDGVEVTLTWVHGAGEDATVVSVYDSREGAYFEIPAEPFLALDVYHHPFAYRDFSTVDYEDSRLAEAVDEPPAGTHTANLAGGVRLLVEDADAADARRPDPPAPNPKGATMTMTSTSTATTPVTRDETGRLFGRRRAWSR